MVFRAIVYRTLVSGLTSFVLSARDYIRLESCLCVLVRKLLRGAGCEKRQQGETVLYKAMSNHDVLRLAGLAPLQVELCVSRLQLVQRALVHMKAREQFLTALFGRLPFEAEHDVQRHGWLKQFCSDSTGVKIRSLEGVNPRNRYALPACKKNTWHAQENLGLKSF